MQRKLTKDWPSRIRMALWGIRSRDTAVVTMWSCAALTAITIIAALLFGAIELAKELDSHNGVFFAFLSGTSFYAALEVRNAIRWLDTHGWPLTA